MQPKWIIISGVLLLFAVACNNSAQEEGSGKIKDTMHHKKEAVIYTCPMHHQIRSDKPGKCPICGMDLIPLDAQETKNSGDTTVKLTIAPRQQLLANIHTDTAHIAPLSDRLVLTGNTIFDPQHQDVISAWVSGWIERMYVRNPGEKISTGQKLYDLYSPDLLSAEKDYLLALEQKDLFKKASVDFAETIRAMKQKLSRWGLSTKEIEQLKEKSPTGSVTIYSKSSGYLTQKMKEEGDYVKEGEVILNLVKNNTLWVQAQLYDTELPLLSSHPEIWVTLDAVPGKRIPGKIVFNNPVNENNSRVHLLNIAISNVDDRIQPGMLAYVYLQTAKREPTVVIPKSSVIYGEKNRYVWIALPENKYERRAVRLGRDNSTVVQVLEGVKTGELVVSSGAYLVNSEYILRYGSGVNMSGMQMSDMKMSGRGK